MTELVESHVGLCQDWAEVEGLLQRLGPAWAELRLLLNELNRVLGPDAPHPPARRDQGAA